MGDSDCSGTGCEDGGDGGLPTEWGLFLVSIVAYTYVCSHPILLVAEGLKHIETVREFALFLNRENPSYAHTTSIALAYADRGPARQRQRKKHRESSARRVWRETETGA